MLDGPAGELWTYLGYTGRYLVMLLLAALQYLQTFADQALCGCTDNIVV